MIRALVMVALGTAMRSQPATVAESGDGSSESDRGAALLADVRDLTEGFNEPAFYWLMRRAASEAGPSIAPAGELQFAAASSIAEPARPAAESSGSTRIQSPPRPQSANQPPAESIPWQALIERPAEYRGRRVVVEGVVASCVRYTIDGPAAPGLGPLMQTELSDAAGERLTTVMSPDPGAALPIGAHVRAAGWFYKIRAFSTAGGVRSHAPLIVAPIVRVRDARPSGAAANSGATESAGAAPIVVPDGRAAARDARRVRNMLLIGIAVLLCIWLYLRRTTRDSGRRTTGDAAGTRIRPSRASSRSPADGELDWLLARDETAAARRDSRKSDGD